MDTKRAVLASFDLSVSKRIAVEHQFTVGMKSLRLAREFAFRLHEMWLDVGW